MIGFLGAETTNLSRNVGKQLPSDAASFRRMTDISTTQLRKLEQSHFPGWSLPSRCVIKDFEKHVVHCLRLSLPKAASREILIQKSTVF